MTPVINKIIPIWLKDKQQKTLWILITSLIGVCWFLDPNNTFLKAIQTIEQTITVKIVLTLFLVALGLVSSIIILLKKPKLKDYHLINPPGFLKHKKTGGYYCQPCLIKKHIPSELSVTSAKEFQCRSCNGTYKIDYEVLINNSYLSIVQDNDPIFNNHDKAVNELIHKKDNG